MKVILRSNEGVGYTGDVVKLRTDTPRTLMPKGLAGASDGWSGNRLPL